MPIAMRVIRFKTIFWVSIASCFLALAPTLTFSLQDQTATFGCKKLDKTYDSLYILFERTGISTEEGSKERYIWLRLRNNTSCTVLLDIIGSYYRLVDGKATNQVLDGEEIRINYNLETESGRKNHYKTHNFGVVWLLPGRSVVFDLPSKYLEKGYRVVVPFGFDWDGSWGLSRNPRFEVLFNTSELPQGWEKIISPTILKSSKD